MKTVGWFLFWAITGLVAKAQNPDSVKWVLPEVVIEESLQSPPAGGKLQQIDPVAIKERQTATLGEILGQFTPVFIRSYGAGGLSSPSFRGTGAGHTQVYWQGVRLNSPMLGQVDLSLFPLSLTDAVTVRYGSASLPFGAGGLGGSVHIDSKPNMDGGFRLSALQSGGSFGQYTGNVCAFYGTQRWQASTRLFVQRADNDFPFRNIAEAGRPVQKNTRAEMMQSGALQEIFISLNPRQTLQASLWLQDAQRNIPPPMTVKMSRESQADDGQRLALRWNFAAQKFQTEIVAAYLNEGITYRNELNNLVSKSRNQGVQLHPKAAFRLLKKIETAVGANFFYDRARTTAYATAKQQTITGLYLSAEHRPFKFLKIGALLRQDFINLKPAPFLPMAGAEASFRFKKYGFLKAKLNAARNYHAPTLNDRYWQPVGNPYLKPERSWGADGGLTWGLEKKRLSLEHELTAYTLLTDDWILWTPGVSGLWRPQNLKRVWSRGLETQFNGRLLWRKWRIEGRLSYAYTVSENILPAQQPDATVGRQLIYLPIHNAQAGLTVSWRGFRLVYEQSGYGKRYIATDGSSFLPHYFLSNAAFSKQFFAPNLRIEIRLAVNNLWDAAYQSIAFRPMPGRSFQGSVSLSWTGTKH